jgi:Mn2+/Fe2+ NRAMP family transporter
LSTLTGPLPGLARVKARLAALGPLKSQAGAQFGYSLGWTLLLTYLSIVVAIFGTTISPYLFFWQAGEEVEDEKEDPEAKPLIKAPLQAPRQLARIQLDTLVGMGISNIIALFIMITTAATLNAHGVTDIQTSSHAAEALCPIAGRLLLRFLPWASSAPACLHYRSSRAAPHTR